MGLNKNPELFSGTFELPPVSNEDTELPENESEIIQWCEARLEQGRKFVQSSIGYDKIEGALRAIFANERARDVSYNPTGTGSRLSKTNANFVAKTAEDIVALLTDTRVFWNYSTHNFMYQDQARFCNYEAEEWYRTYQIDLRFADIIRYYTAAGTGYGHLYFSRRINNMMLDAIDPRHVFPIEPVSYHTVQDALGVIIEQARTPNWVWSEFQRKVSPDVAGSSIFGWMSQAVQIAAAKISGPLSPNRRNQDADSIPAYDTVYVRTMYLTDNRINQTQKTYYMGNWETGPDGKLGPKNSWSYEVKPGMPWYPFKRMLVWTRDCLLYDGTSPYWHAMFPVFKVTLNPWPKAWLGKAPLTDVRPLNNTVNRLLRVADDHFEQVAEPGAIGDRNVSEAQMKKFQTREAGWKIRTNMASGKGIQVVYPNPLDAQLFPYIEKLEAWMKMFGGTADVSQMAQLAQIPSDDTIDTIMKAMTPNIRLRSRIVEGFMVEFAKMYLYSIVQFDTLPKRIAKFGPSAVTKEDYDYRPGNFIPDDVPDGQPGDIASQMDALALEGERPLWKRARAMLESFAMNYKASSLLNTAAQQDRMEDLMLSKMGFLSFFTLMENLGRMNIVPPSMTIPTSEIERLALQQQLGIGMIANAQGRKATNAAPPKLATDGSGDVTLQTS